MIGLVDRRGRRVLAALTKREVVAAGSGAILISVLIFEAILLLAKLAH